MKNFNISSYLTLENYFLGAVSLTKNNDINQCKYPGKGIGFDRKGTFSFGNGVGSNAISFGVDMSLSKEIDNRKRDILILGKGPTQELEHKMSAEKMYLFNMTENNKKIVRACIIVEQIVIYLLMVQKLLSKRFWNCGNSIMLMKHFKRLVSR